MDLWKSRQYRVPNAAKRRRYIGTCTRGLWGNVDSDAVMIFAPPGQIPGRFKEMNMRPGDSWRRTSQPIKVSMGLLSFGEQSYSY
jgi:hypothetical protein